MQKRESGSVEWASTSKDKGKRFFEESWEYYEDTLAQKNLFIGIIKDYL